MITFSEKRINVEKSDLCFDILFPFFYFLLFGFYFQFSRIIFLAADIAIKFYSDDL